MRIDRARRLGGLIALAAAGLGACGNDVPIGSSKRLAAREAAGATVVVCRQSAPESLDPFVSPDLAAADLLPVLYTSLVRYDSAAQIVPHLASRWRWDEAHRKLTVAIRPGVRWHDGEPVTAEDVAWTIRTAADTAFGYWNALDFATLAEAKALDDTTLEVRFSEPYPAGVEPFAVMPVLPKHLLGRLDAERFRRAPYHDAPVGSGPYRFLGKRADGSLAFERVDDFPEAMGRPAIRRLVLRAIPETPSMLMEMQTGQVDACISGSSAAEEVEHARTLRALPIEPSGTQVIPLAVNRPPFDDVRVRRALSAALDRRELAATISPLARPAGNFLPASSPYRDDSLAEPDANPRLAAALLDSAGWRGTNRSGIRVNARGRPLEFTIMGPTTYRELLTAVQGQLRRSGIDARIQLLEASSYMERIQNPETRPVAMALSFNPERVVAYDPSGFLHSEGWSNLSSYKEARVDSLVEALGSMVKDADRARVYGELQRRIATDVPVIHVLYAPRIVAVGPRLKGVVVGAAGPFGGIAKWEMK